MCRCPTNCKAYTLQLSFLASVPFSGLHMSRQKKLLQILVIEHIKAFFRPAANVSIVVIEWLETRRTTTVKIAMFLMVKYGNGDRKGMAFRVSRTH